MLFDAEYDTYQWTIVSGTGGAMEGAGTVNREYFTWSMSGQKVISVTVTDDKGCKGTATQVIEIQLSVETGPIYRVPNR